MRTLEKRRMILYIITQSEWGGAQRYVFDLATSLHDDWDVAVAFGEQGDTGAFAHVLREHGISTTSIPSLKRSIDLVHDIGAVREIVSLIRRTKPDIVHLNSSKVSIVGSVACSLAKWVFGQKLQVVYTAHGWVFSEPLPVWKRALYRIVEWITASLKDAIICVSEHDLLLAQKARIAPPRKLMVVHNGIEAVHFLPKEVSQEILFRYGKPGREPEIVIGSIGNLYATKGFPYLIEAARIYKERGRCPIAVYIIGEGDEREALLRLIYEAKVGDMVFLTGAVPQAAKLLSAFDLYVCTSVKEGLSYTLIEALQAGLPIIATDVGGNAEVLGRGEAGMLIPAGSAEDMARAIERLAGSSGERRTYASHARARGARFTKERMVEGTEAVYKEILEK